MTFDMDKIEVYHAGTDRVENPDCLRGRKNLDFGQGFYVTDIYEQAHSFSISKSRDRKQPALINTYLLDRKSILEESRHKIFENYDENWLDFIVACRAGNDVWKDFDYIEGGVADDRVIDTVNMYVQGFISKERALQNLIYLKPNNQICILNQHMLDKHLNFIDCLTIPTNGLL